MSIRTDALLDSIYSGESTDVGLRLDRLIDSYREHVSSPDGYRPGALPLDESDSFLLADDDWLHDQSGEDAPLEGLLRFLDDEAEGVVSGVHLPGPWTDIESLASEFTVMVDLVVIGLDFSDPDVLLETLDVLLGYLTRGARVVRLHQPTTHAVVKLVRAVIDEIAPWIILVTETNVPHAEGVSFFGSGDDEAHMVCSSELAPLTLDAFLREDSGDLQRWAATLRTPSVNTTFFNLLASDDTYLDALAPATLQDTRRARVFLAAHSIVLALAGVPGISYHSLVGGPNREKLDLAEGVKGMLRARAGSPAFHPSAAQTVLSTPAGAFGLLRVDALGSERVLCLTAVSSEEVELSFTDRELSIVDERVFEDLITGTLLYPSRDDGNRISVLLEPYEVLWLRY